MMLTPEARITIRNGGEARFQGLSILWQEIEPAVQSEDRLVNEMVEQIEDPLFAGPCESIKNWDYLKKTFRDAAATMRAHEIGKNAGRPRRLSILR